MFWVLVCAVIFKDCIGLGYSQLFRTTGSDNARTHPMLASIYKTATSIRRLDYDMEQLKNVLKVLPEDSQVPKPTFSNKQYRRSVRTFLPLPSIRSSPELKPVDDLQVHARHEPPHTHVGILSPDMHPPPPPPHFPPPTEPFPSPIHSQFQKQQHLRRLAVLPRPCKRRHGRRPGKRRRRICNMLREKVKSGFRMNPWRTKNDDSREIMLQSARDPLQKPREMAHVERISPNINNLTVYATNSKTGIGNPLHHEQNDISGIPRNLTIPTSIQSLQVNYSRDKIGKSNKTPTQDHAVSNEQTAGSNISSTHTTVTDISQILQVTDFQATLTNYTSDVGGEILYNITANETADVTKESKNLS